MASAAETAGYEADRLETIEDLKDAGQLVQITGETESGSPVRRTKTPFSNDHYALAMELEHNDIVGNVQGTSNKWMVDASAEINSSMKLVNNGTEEEIVHVSPVRFDGSVVIFYWVFTER